MEYKFVELLSLKFAASPEDVVRLHVSYKYNVMKMRMQLMQQRLVDISAMLKVKNPSLLLQLQRTPSRMPPPANSPPAPVSSAYASAAARQPFR